MGMLLKDVSLWHNALALFFTWIVLAGFLFLPGSFGTLSKLQFGGAYQNVLSALQNLPLYVPFYTLSNDCPIYFPFLILTCVVQPIG